MTLLFIIVGIWALAKLAETVARKNAQRKAEAERQRIRQEQERIKLEQRRQAENYRTMVKRQAEEQKALVRIEKEQALQAKEQERLAKEQKKQALAILDLQYRMKSCEEEHRAAAQRLENLEELHELENQAVIRADRAGDDVAKAKALRKIISIDKQIAAAEKQERDCRYKWFVAQEKLKDAEAERKIS